MGHGWAPATRHNLSLGHHSCEEKVENEPRIVSFICMSDRLRGVSSSPVDPLLGPHRAFEFCFLTARAVFGWVFSFRVLDALMTAQVSLTL